MMFRAMVLRNIIDGTTSTVIILALGRADLPVRFCCQIYSSAFIKYASISPCASAGVAASCKAGDDDGDGGGDCDSDGDGVDDGDSHT
jgi:hypothetical protein